MEFHQIHLKNLSIFPLSISPFNNKGQSILQALIAIAILGIAMMGFLTMQSAQQKEMKASEEKMGVLSIKNLLLNVLMDGTVCKFELKNKTFNTSSQAAIDAVSIPINQFHLKNNNTSPIILKVSSTTPALPDSKSLFVNSIKLTNLVGAGTDYAAEWVISFDSSKLVRSLKPISIPVLITVDRSNPAASKIKYCGGSETPDVIKGNNPTCPDGQEPMMRYWTTPTCSLMGWTCHLYNGWSGATPMCESCTDWEKCHLCYSQSWNAVQCIDK